MAGHAGRSGCDRDYERAVDRAATIRLDRGRNVQIDYRWGAVNADRIRDYSIGVEEAKTKDVSVP